MNFLFIYLFIYLNKIGKNRKIFKKNRGKKGNFKSKKEKYIYFQVIKWGEESKTKNKIPSC